MKITSLMVLKCIPEGSDPIILANASDVSQFGFFQRSSVREFLVFVSRTVGKRTSPGQRQSVQHEEYKVHSHNRNGLCAIGFMDDHYPVRSAFSLLNQIEEVVKAYDVKFVVNISELGEDDPLVRNVTGLSPLLNVPWYTTGGSKCAGLGCFLKQIKLPCGRTLDIVGLNTATLQDAALVGLSSGMRNNISNWLTRTLKTTMSSWCIVFGFHSLVACEEAKRNSEALHRIYVKFGVNVYLSQQGCFTYALQDSVAYIGNPGLTKENLHLDSANQRYRVRKEMTNGFLLHRLSSLEMGSTRFIFN